MRKLDKHNVAAYAYVGSFILLLIIAIICGIIDKILN